MVSYTSEDGENREEGNFFKSFCLLTQCQEKDRTVFSAREVTNAWERSERILCRKVKIEKKRKKGCPCLLTAGGWWGGRGAQLPVPGFVLWPSRGRQDGRLYSQSESAHLISSHLTKDKVKAPTLGCCNLH